MRIKKLIAMSFLLASIFTVGVKVTPAKAMTPVEYGDLTWSINSIYYYITSGVSSSYTTPISNAAKNWYYPGWTNKLSPNTRTYTQGDSAMDFHQYADSTDGYAAYTTFWTGSSTQVSADNSDWSWCKINLNDSNMKTLDSNTEQGVVGHEMGHVYGLDEDYNNTYSIMYATVKGKNVYTVQKPDNDAFNYKHP